MIMAFRRPGACREEKQVHRGSNRICTEAGEARHERRRGIRKMGISEATFYNWRKKYGGLGLSELRRLCQLEEENRRLKQIVADLSLDKAMLQAVVARKT